MQPQSNGRRLLRCLMECMLGLTKQNVFLLFFAPTQGAHLLIATLCGYKGVTDAITEIELRVTPLLKFTSRWM